MPAQPTSYGSAPIPVAVQGAGDGVLWLNQWQDGGGSSVFGASLVIKTEVTRLEGGHWVPVVNLVTGGIHDMVEPAVNELVYIDGITVYRVGGRSH